MKKTVAIIGIILTIVVVLAGCGSSKGETVTGTWERDDGKDTLVFGENNAFSSSNMWSSGTYSIDGDMLKVNTARSKEFTFNIETVDDKIVLTLTGEHNTFTYYKSEDK